MLAARSRPRTSSHTNHTGGAFKRNARGIAGANCSRFGARSETAIVLKSTNCTPVTSPHHRAQGIASTL
jgi:hypothetical protein